MNETLVSLLAPFGWFIFGGLMVLFLVMGVVLHYHWSHYGINRDWLKKVRLIFFGVGTVFLAGMFISLVLGIQ